jgi:chemotaxis family two-component system sensor kinase Cph1
MQLILDQVIRNLKLSIQEKGAIITRQGMTTVVADEGQITQLLQNLIENSLRYSTKLPRIHISCEAIDGYYQFSIKDNGIGIEQQYLERIFKIFQRLHPKALYEGNGIGLAICKRIIERHKGKIWAESDPGNGSTFYFTIPKINSQ